MIGLILGDPMRLPARAGLAFALAMLVNTGGAEAGLITRVATGAAAGRVLAAMFGGFHAAPTGLVIRQHSNGLPGRAQADVVPQTLYVGERALRIEDAVGGGRYTIVRVDEEKIYEVDPRVQQYTTQGFDYFRRERTKAEQDREEARKMIVERFRGEERAAELKKRHLREDGKREIRVERAPGDTILGHHTRRTSILLNEAPALVVYTTDEITEYKPPKVLFEFYEKSGLFPDDVVAELKKIDGFPLRIWANVDFFSSGAEIETNVDDVHAWSESAASFEVPANFQAVQEFARTETPREALKCALCGKPIKRGDALPVPGEPGVYVDSQDHLVEYIIKKKSK